MSLCEETIREYFGSIINVGVTKEPALKKDKKSRA
jgi:hypothetical protein